MIYVRELASTRTRVGAFTLRYHGQKTGEFRSTN